VTDFATGKQVEILHKLEIRRAVFLPAKALRDFSYDLSFIAANKNFTYGGFYDHRNRRILVDRRDIVADWPVDLNMHVLHRGKRWEIKNIFEYEDEECLVIILDGLTGARPMDQIDGQVDMDLGGLQAGGEAVL
jgi:hypothetical protein